jgi:hypothetical protein
MPSIDIITPQPINGPSSRKIRKRFADYPSRQTPIGFDTTVAITVGRTTPPLFPHPEEP